MSAFPSPDRFAELAERHPVVPVWREVIADTLTPVGAFMRLDPKPTGFLLESVEGGERWARYSFVGGDASAVITARGKHVDVAGDVHERPEPGEPPLAYVRRLLGTLRGPQVDALPPLHGGAVGYIGYDCVRELERLPQPPPDDLGLPDLALMLARSLVVFDHLAQKAFVVTNVIRPPDARRAYDEAVTRCDALIERLARPDGESVRFLEAASAAAADVITEVDDAEFARWVERVKEHIVAGDIFQAVPSRRFSAPLTEPCFDVYRRLRTLNPSPYMYFLRFAGDDLEIAGSSPEPLVRVQRGEVVTRPIAGTRKRGADPAEDEALARGLLADPKERAEHIMLVDLARNDVGRVARFGTVEVETLMAIERYSHVMHIVSSVKGRLREDVDAFDALTACFPAGTVSGAPKVRAMEIVDSLELTKRGPYAGVVGYFDLAGDIDTCITIRTLLATGGRAYVQAGAGVVADSDPDAEAEETRRKAAGVLAALGGGARAT